MTTTTHRHYARNAIIAIAVLIGLLTPSEAYAYQKGTSPTPTPTITREERNKSSTRLRGEDEWAWINYREGDYLAALRYDMESEFGASYMIDMFGDPDMVEQELDMYFEDTFRVRGTECIGIELYDPDNDITIYLAACADDEYVNLVMGTDRRDVLAAMTNMQAGNVPAVEGYTEVEP